MILHVFCPIGNRCVACSAACNNEPPLSRPSNPSRCPSGPLSLGFPSGRGHIALEEDGDGRDARKFDRDFKEGAVRLVRETDKPVAQVARNLGINEGTLGNWVNAGKRGEADGALSEDERAELARLRKENAELAMERDVLKRSVAHYAEDAMGR